LTFVTVT